MARGFLPVFLLYYFFLCASSGEATAVYPFLEFDFPGQEKMRPGDDYPSAGKGEVPAGSDLYTLRGQEDQPLAPRNEKKAPARPDWKGLGRDTLFFELYQPVVAGVFYLLPESVIGYTREQKKFSANKWWQHIKEPRADRDSFWLNFVAHPYWGAAFYMRARERGFNRLEAFGYSAFLSLVFEFQTESLFEPPSYNDMIATPVLGAFVGIFFFEPLREYVKSKARLAWYDHLTLGITDPLGAANSALERWLGINSDIRVYYRPGDSRQPARCFEETGRDCLRPPEIGFLYTTRW